MISMIESIHNVKVFVFASHFHAKAPIRSSYRGIPFPQPAIQMMLRFRLNQFRCSLEHRLDALLLFIASETCLAFSSLHMG